LRLQEKILGVLRPHPEVMQAMLPGPEEACCAGGEG
jgi:hypothetical protein